MFRYKNLLQIKNKCELFITKNVPNVGYVVQYIYWHSYLRMFGPYRILRKCLAQECMVACPPASLLFSSFWISVSLRGYDGGIKTQEAQWAYWSLNVKIGILSPSLSIQIQITRVQVFITLANSSFLYREKFGTPGYFIYMASEKR